MALAIFKVLDRRSFFSFVISVAVFPLIPGVGAMADIPTDARKNFGDLAPHLADITDKVLFGDVWQNPALSPRDRSLVTITSLISLYRVNELLVSPQTRARERRHARRDRRNDHASCFLCGMAAGDDRASDRPQGVR